MSFKCILSLYYTEISLFLGCKEHSQIFQLHYFWRHLSNHTGICRYLQLMQVSFTHREEKKLILSFGKSSQIHSGGCWGCKYVQSIFIKSCISLLWLTWRVSPLPRFAVFSLHLRENVHWRIHLSTVFCYAHLGICRRSPEVRGRLGCSALLCMLLAAQRWCTYIPLSPISWSSCSQAWLSQMSLPASGALYDDGGFVALFN